MANNVREYLATQQPYLQRIHNTVREISKKYKPEDINNPEDAMQMLLLHMEITENALGLIQTFNEFVRGQAEEYELYGYTSTGFEIYPEGGLMELDEHKIRTIPFGMN